MPSVTRKSQTTRAARRAELRERLLEVVERLLAQGESFTEMSVEQLVSEAGLSRSTFYVYFEDKGDLLRAWLGDIINQVAESSQQWYGLSTDATRADLRRALRHVVETYAPHTTLMAAVLDASTYDASVRAGVTEIMNRDDGGCPARARRRCRRRCCRCRPRQRFRANALGRVLLRRCARGGLISDLTRSGCRAPAWLYAHGSPRARAVRPAENFDIHDGRA